MYKQIRITPPEQPKQSPEPPEAVQSTPEPQISQAVTTTPSPRLMAIFAVGGGVVLLCVALLAIVISNLGGRGAENLPTSVQPAAVIVEPTEAIPTAPPVTPTPSCTAATSYLEIITRQEQANRWEAAVATAETGLGDTGLCPADRKLLTARAVADGLRVLYNKQFEPLDTAAQQQEVDSYLALRQRAADAQVPFDTPLQVAGQAYQIGQFPLVRVAIEQALSDGDYHPEVDRATTRMYISTLYNIGHWYTQAPPGSALHQQGLSWLAASHQLAVKYQTGQAEAAMLLRQLAGQEESGWPTPAQTPLLNTQ